MIYKIFARKGNKALCYEVDNIQQSVEGGCSFRDIRNNAVGLCSMDSIVENPVFTGKEFHRFKEIVLYNTNYGDSGGN